METAPLIANDAVVIGLLALILGAVFWTSELKSPFWKRFYGVVPAILLCYFIPSLLTTFGVVDPEKSEVYFVASRYLLPAALVILTAVADLPATLRLGPKALIMFFTGTIGIVIGGPIALYLATLVAPATVAGDGADAVWRGMATTAGSWIGGSANQTALKEIYEVGPNAFSIWVAVDVIIANVWMAILLTFAAKRIAMDRWLKADASAVEAVRAQTEAYEAEHTRNPSLRDLMIILGFALGAMGVSHLVADVLTPWFKENVPAGAQLSLHSSFFWLIVTATVIGVGLSFTPVRKLQGAGATKVGSVMIYFLIATVGLNMNIAALFETPFFFLMGAIWMAIHGGLMLLVAKLIRAPVFFLAVGSMANIGAVASAPVVASAFHPSLAPVGVLLAVVGYIVGTFAGWICGQLMRLVVGG